MNQEFSKKRKLFCLTALLYFVGAELSHSFSFSPNFASVWVASGIALALYGYFPIRRWPVILLGTFTANLLSDTVFHGKSLAVSAGFCTANNLEAACGALLLRRFCVKDRFSFAVTRDVWLFFLVVSLLSPVVGASIGATVVHHAFEAPFVGVWRIWWSGDAIGILVAFPIVWMILTSSELRLNKIAKGPALNSFASLALLQAIVTHYIFGLQENKIAFMALILPVIITAKFAGIGAGFSIVLTAFIATWDTAYTQGIFGVYPDLAERATLLHLFLLSLCATCIGVNLVVSREHQQTFLLKRAKQLLEESEKRFQLAVEGASVGIWDWQDLSTDHSFWSPRFYRMLGYEPGEIAPTIRDFQTKLIHPDDLNRAKVAGEELMAGKKPFDIEYRLRRKQGDYRWFRATAVVDRDQYGNPTRMVGSVQDIHPVKMFQGRLEHSEKQAQQIAATLENVLAHIPNQIYWKDKDLKYRGCNQKFAQFIGLSSAKMILGKSDFDLQSNENRVQNIRDLENQILRSGQGSTDAEESFYREDGSLGYLLTSRVPLHNTDGEVIGLLGIRSDISAIKSNEKQLSELTERHNLALDAVGCGIWDWDMKNDRHVWSERSYALLQIDPSIKASFQEWQDRLHPDDQPIVFTALEEHFKNQTPYQVDIRMRVGESGYQWFRVTGKALFDSDGSPYRMAGSMEDIHEKKMLELGNKKLIEVFDLSDDFIAQWDSEHNLSYMNAAFKRLTNSLHLDWLSSENKEKLYGTVVNQAREQGIWKGEIEVLGPDGQPIPCLLHELCHKTSDGQPDAFTGIFREITEIKKIEDKLRTTNTELEQFAYIASHDLKAPLRGLKNLVAFVSEDIEGLKQHAKKELVAEIDQNISLMHIQLDRMNNLIIGLLEYAQADSNPSLKDFNPHELNASIIATLAVPSGMTVVNNLDSSPLFGNEFRLGQVLSNLISNAIKYHHQPSSGRIVISQKNLGDLVEFKVTDDGPGIAARFHEKIFGMFHTLVPKDQNESTGIGLALVRKIIKGRGGTIRVDSAEGQGASFIFTWPINESLEE